jgi:hypothetical protein
LQQRAPADGSPAFEIISDGVFLMASYNQTSERTLARQAIEAVKPEQDNEFRILVGGLGMGFTLQKCLVCAVDLGYRAGYLIHPSAKSGLKIANDLIFTTSTIISHYLQTCSQHNGLCIVYETMSCRR